MKVKILHCADLHLGGSYTHLPPEKRELRKTEIMDGFNDIINKCISDDVDILLAAGDIFDTPKPPDDTVRDVIAGFARLDATRVFIAPGNHDPYTTVYAEYKFPDNVHIFRQAECVTMEDIKVKVYGAGFAGRIQNTPLIKNLGGMSEEYINLCVLHADIAASSDYNPITMEDISQSGFDYIALGHIHMFSGIKRAGSTAYAYSGTNEGHGFDEIGDKGVILGEISKAGTNLRFVPMNRRKYLNPSVDISGVYSDESAAAAVREAVESAENFPKRHFYKITMTGKTDKSYRPNPAIVSHILRRDGYDVLAVSDKTVPDYNIEAIASENDIRGVFTRVMLERIKKAASDEDRQGLKNALRLGLRAFDGGVEYIEDYTDTY